MPFTLAARPDADRIEPSPRPALLWSLMVAALPALIVLIITRNGKVALNVALPMVLAMLLAAAVSAWVVLRWRTGLTLLLLVPAAAAWVASHGMVGLLALWRDRELAGMLSRPVVERGFAAAPLIGALLGAALWMLHRQHRIEWSAAARRAQADAEREALQRQHAQARLQLLQAQVEPHFIYNTLANLRQLMRHDGPQALAMVDHLIRYFKLSLPSLRADRLALADELELVRAYLDLMRHRIGRALVLQVDVADACLRVQVPPCAVLCLVENAIKHGQPMGDGPLEIRVAAACSEDRMRITVRDNGLGPGHPPAAGGTGLANLRERLRLQWGGARTAVQLRLVAPGCEASIEFPSDGGEPSPQDPGPEAHSQAEPWHPAPAR